MRLSVNNCVIDFDVSFERLLNADYITQILLSNPRVEDNIKIVFSLNFQYDLYIRAI